MTRSRALAVLAGLLIAAGLPPWGWWPLTPVGLGLWFHLTAVESGRRRFGRSALVGVAWAVPSTLWMFDLTAAGWPVVIGFFALLVALAGWVMPGSGPWRPVVFPAAVVLAELIRWHVPFGGVPIATIAMTAVDAPWAVAARLLGSPFLVVVTTTVGVALAEAVHRRRVALVLVGAVVLATVGGQLAGATVEPGDELRVAVVQGGGPQNTRADACENRRVFERHVAATELIDPDDPVDLILWPEDVVHASPDGTPTPARCDDPLLTRTEALDEIARLATANDALMVTGWFERSADGEANVNYSVVTTPDGELGDRYEKVRLVPFGEFVPLRSLIEVVNDEIPGRDVRPGTEPAVLHTELGTLGVSISWEIFFDYRARDAIDAGAEVLLNPTNGSSYWLTIVQGQQVASSRLRALETDRWVLQAAPTGYSAVIDPDGEVLARTGVSEQAVLRATVELRHGRTPAVVLGPWPVLVASLAVVAASEWRRRRAPSALTAEA